MVSRVVSHSLAAQTLPSELQETPSPVTLGTECWILNDLRCSVCPPMTICMRRKIHPVCRKSIQYTQVSLMFQILCQLHDEFLHFYSAFCSNQTAHSWRTINYWRHISMKVTELHMTSHKICLFPIPLHTMHEKHWSLCSEIIWCFTLISVKEICQHLSGFQIIEIIQIHSLSFLLPPVHRVRH